MTRRPIGLSVPYRKKADMFTLDEIIEMARSVGIDKDEMNTHWAAHLSELEAFAKLAVARAKEKNK